MAKQAGHRIYDAIKAIGNCKEVYIRRLYLLAVCAIKARSDDLLLHGLFTRRLKLLSAQIRWPRVDDL